LSAGRALLLQLAHPWVAAAVVHHSDTFANPIGRFHRAFSTVFMMVFGTLDQSLEAARRLHPCHTAIGGTLLAAANCISPIGHLSEIRILLASLAHCPQDLGHNPPKSGLQTFLFQLPDERDEGTPMIS
jgi:ER-bound oxygenase mpaB/B'/Rubber oxygenase, catalytic domain